MQDSAATNANANIYLVGYMASGKTTIGKKMAHKLGKVFVDLDELIEQRENATISEIFAQKGEDAFRKIEREVLEATKYYKDSLISCGGGTPCFFDNMDWMNANGVTVYIKTNAGILASRLISCKDTRPILSALNNEEILIFVQEQLNHRTQFYEKATICYDTQNDTMEKVLKLL